MRIGEAIALDRSDFDADLGFDEGWTRYNRHSWRRDYHGFLEFFFSNCFTEATFDEADRGRRRVGLRD